MVVVVVMVVVVEELELGRTGCCWACRRRCSSRAARNDADGVVRDFLEFF